MIEHSLSRATEVRLLCCIHHLKQDRCNKNMCLHWQQWIFPPMFFLSQAKTGLTLHRCLWRKALNGALQQFCSLSEGKYNYETLIIVEAMFRPNKRVNIRVTKTLQWSCLPWWTANEIKAKTMVHENQPWYHTLTVFLLRFLFRVCWRVKLCIVLHEPCSQDLGYKFPLITAVTNILELCVKGLFNDPG